MIELKNVTKQYGDTEVLKDINLSIEQGEIFGIVGRSGAGKSTLIRCINLLEVPTSGDVIIDQQAIRDDDPQALRRTRQKIGMIFQHFNLMQRKTVAANIALPLQFAHGKADKIKHRVSELCELVGLSDKQDHFPKQLSGGQQQRVAIARALASQPQILLCDEATSALDPETTTSILKLLQSINKELKLTIVLITHEMSVVKSICDRVAIIDKGQIQEINSPLQLLLNPQSTIAKEFLTKAITSHIPAGLLNHIQAFANEGSVPLAHLSFVGDTASEPLIAKLASKYSISVNILQADIEYVNGVSLGHMLVELPRDEDKMQQAIDYFSQYKVQVEVMGYVPHHVL